MTSRRRHAAPPPLLRRALLALGVAAVAVGCTAVTEGTAQRSAEDATTTTAPSTNTPTSSAPPTVTTAELIGLLLKRSELAEIVADNDLELISELTEPTVVSVDVTPFACRGIAVAGDSRGWSPTTRALRGNGYRGAGGQAVTQIVMLVKSPEVAATGMSSTESAWRRCPLDETFTMKSSGIGVQEWLVRDVSSSADPLRLTATYVRQSEESRECSHVLGTVSNILVESQVCGRSGESAAQAAAVVDRIVEDIVA